MFEYYNPNPHGKRVGDCVVRALSKVLNKSWHETYIMLCIQGYMLSDLPSSDQVWGEFLRSQGFKRGIVDEECKSVKDFCKMNPEGTFVVGTGSHAIGIVDGDYFDAWDSGCEQAIYYYRKDD